MELPFTGFELSFLLIAFIVFSLLSLASIYYEADASRAEQKRYIAKKGHTLWSRVKCTLT
uniref:Uncharacterized protein n=1 Tax=Gadus morhua TaxID=8049 RepID=A0A8C5C6D5_GADMO